MNPNAVLRRGLRTPTASTPLRTSLTRLATALCALALAAAGVAQPALAAPSPVKPAKTVVVVLTPFLTWGDALSPSGAPVRQLADKGAIGDMNSITADSWWPVAAGGALTLGAGKWTAAASQAPATPASLARH
jgi:hypothetical protein